MGNKRAVFLLSAAALCGFGCDSTNSPAPTPTTGGTAMGTGATPATTGGMTPVSGGMTPVSGGMTPVSGGMTPVSGGMTPPAGGVIEQTECPGGDRVDPVGECAATAAGKYAMKTTLDVYWNPEPDAPGAGHSTLVNPGRGKMDILMLGEIYDLCQGPDKKGAGMGRVSACGTTLPAFSSQATCGIMDITIADTAWNTVEPFGVNGTVTDFEVGATLQLGPTDATIGILMDDVTGEFPTAATLGDYTCNGGASSGFDCFPDEDNDGFPGITAQIRNDNAPAAPDGYPEECGVGPFRTSPYFYRPAPSSPDPSALGGDNIDSAPQNYIKTVRIGLRIKLGGGGVIDAGCMTGQGAVADAQIDFIVIDCVLNNDEPCDAAQANFLAEKTPKYNVLNAGETPTFLPLNTGDRGFWGAWTFADTSESEGSKGALVRLGDLDDTTVGCDQVRAATFPF